jgi:RecB family exonuclease
MTAYTEGLNVLMSQPHTDHMVDRKHSPSSLKCYADCPKLYYLQRVLGIPGPPHSFFHLGTVMHDVLEKLAPKLADGESVSLAEASALLDTQWRPSMFNSETDYQNNREEAMEMLELFLRRQEEWNGTPVGVEKWISVDLGGRTIRGKVDRIDDMGDTLSIIDYKTSKRPESKNKLKKNIQMAVYHLGVEALDRPEYDKSVGMVGHWNLRPDKDKPDRPSHVMVELGEEELEATKAEMLRIIEGIERGEFDATPGSSCRYCDYSELCDDYEG